MLSRLQGRGYVTSLCAGKPETPPGWRYWRTGFIVGGRPPEAQVLWDLPVEVTATAGQPYPHDKMGFLFNYEIAFGLRYAYKLEEVFFLMYRHVYRTLRTVVRSGCWIWGDVLWILPAFSLKGAQGRLHLGCCLRSDVHSVFLYSATVETSYLIRHWTHLSDIQKRLGEDCSGPAGLRLEDGLTRSRTPTLFTQQLKKGCRESLCALIYCNESEFNRYCLDFQIIF